MKFVLAALVAATFCGFAGAQVHKCTDARGKTTFSEMPCAGTEKGGQVLGAEATQKRWEPEGYRLQEQMDSIARSGAIDRAAVDIATRQSQGPAGAAIINHDPNERINAQSERNMQKKMAEIDAARRRREREDAIPVINAGDPGGCYDNRGTRYNNAGGGNFWREDGKFCHRVGTRLNCS